MVVIQPKKHSWDTAFMQPFNKQINKINNIEELMF